MNSDTITFEGIALDITYEYSPETAATFDCPGEEEYFAIETVVPAKPGEDISELMVSSWDRFEREALRQLKEKWTAL